MAKILNMPSLSPSMEQGTLESWAKKVGDFIKSGDVLAQIETDKAVVEYEVLDDGYLRHFFVQKGQAAAVGQPIAILAESLEEDISAELAQASQKSGPAPTPLRAPERESQASATAHHAEVAVPPPPVVQPPPPPPPSDGRLKASPLARKIATEHGLDLRTVRGSGPEGRIVKEDVEHALKRGKTPAPAPLAAPAPLPAPAPAAKASAPASGLELEGEYTETPLTGMRKTIANRLLEATQGIPHFFLTVKVQTDKLMALREQLNQNIEAKEGKISLNDMILKACGNALMQHPQVNSRFTETSIITFKNAHVGFAVATPEGLITPIVRNVNQKGLGQIARETKEMAGRAKEKRLAIAEFTGGTFGTSNLGMMGIDQFTAIINPPQSCNMAIGGAFDELQMDDEGKIFKTKQMKLTLSCDHRVVDGAVGASFLKTLKSLLENPLTLML